MPSRSTVNRENPSNGNHQPKHSMRYYLRFRESLLRRLLEPKLAALIGIEDVRGAIFAVHLVPVDRPHIDLHLFRSHYLAQQLLPSLPYFAKAITGKKPRGLTGEMEHAKASIRAAAEHPFRVIKHPFGYCKVRDRGPCVPT